MSDHAALLVRIREIAAESLPGADRLERICRLMRAECSGYDWVGIYMVDPRSPAELILGPYDGAPTDHSRIAFGQGICGQAAARGETFVIDDVTQEDNYLSCGVEVRSEIVVPVFHGEVLVGELDIDSHRESCFSAADRTFCESVAACIGAAVEHARA